MGNKNAKILKKKAKKQEEPVSRLLSGISPQTYTAIDYIIIKK